jgi:hypothetical protein
MRGVILNRTADMAKPRHGCQDIKISRKVNVSRRSSLIILWLITERSGIPRNNLQKWLIFREQVLKRRRNAD